MKLALALFLAACGLIAQAGEIQGRPQLQPDSVVLSFSAPICNFWNYMNSPNAGGGYVCSTYPMSMAIPDARNLQMVIDQLESRIQALEAKVKSLEARQQ